MRWRSSLSSIMTSMASNGGFDEHGGVTGQGQGHGGGGGGGGGGTGAVGMDVPANGDGSGSGGAGTGERKVGHSARKSVVFMCLSARVRACACFVLWIFPRDGVCLVW